MSKEETYSIPIYEDGVKTKWAIEGIVGDEKYQQLIEMTPENKLPTIFNVNLKPKQKIKSYENIISKITI
jgi:hypothetical protein